MFKKIKIDLVDYQEIPEYVEIVSGRNNINIKTVASQIASVINELKNTVTYNQYMNLSAKTDYTDALFGELHSAL
ncbi:MAG: hypothetical protein FWH43_03890 [Endomicrobia bacterium]|nr:hypothetical protein [Endomicrobiia bacterium]